MSAFKASTELYRTINGERFIGWRSDINNYAISAYRAAGVRVVRRGVELFVHHLDKEKALAVERSEVQP